MSRYLSPADVDAALEACRDATAAILRAQKALRTEHWAVEQLEDARSAVARARQIASISDDFNKGRLAEKPYGWTEPADA